MAKKKNSRVVCHVTDEIINIAVPKDSGHCLGAEAMKVALPHAKAIAVDLATCRWTDPELRERYVALTPRKLQEA